MKRKVAKVGRLRLSPNEEASLLKEDYERRKKLRLLQVREQERCIAFQIRQEVKQRRNQHLNQLAAELKAEWHEAKNQKIKDLEKLYLASLKAVGEGHRLAKENEPDFVAVAKQAAERQQRAEERHKEALKEQKKRKDKLLKERTWHVRARQKALQVEKERAEKIASLPPPSPYPFENIELKRVPTAKTYNTNCFSVTHHHHLLEPCVGREMGVEQPDARLAAGEEAKRLEERQKDGAQEQKQRMEKARLRGIHALKAVHLAQDREKLMKELEQLQQQDLARRRQIVAQMPPQLFEPPHRRVELKEDWQRELEFAFEDMYNAGRKVKGDLILHLEPEPLPALSEQRQDEELDLSVEPDQMSEPGTQEPLSEEETTHPREAETAKETQPARSKVVLKKLLNKIRSQKDQWTAKTVAESDTLTIESGTLSSETRPICREESALHKPEFGYEPESSETADQIPGVESSSLLHPQEQAVRIRKIARREKQREEIEKQQQNQLDLLEPIESQRLRLEDDFLMARTVTPPEEEKKKKQEAATQTSEVTDPEVVVAADVKISKEDRHKQMIYNYQQRLIQQNRLHTQSVEVARKRLQEYQALLKQRYPSMSTAALDADSVPLESRSRSLILPSESSGQETVGLQRPAPPQTLGKAASQECAQPLRLYSKTAPVSESSAEESGREQRSKMGPIYLVQPVDISQLEHSCFQWPQRNSFPAREEETQGMSSTPDVLTARSPPVPAKQHLQNIPVASLSKTRIPEREFSLETEGPSGLSQARLLDKGALSGDSAHLPGDSVTLDQHLFGVHHSSAGKTPQIPRAASLDPENPQQTLVEQAERTGFQHASPHSFLLPGAQRSLGSPSCPESRPESEKSQGPAASPQEPSPPSSGRSSILRFRERLVASSERILVQQDHLKALQEQLNVQREALQCSQRAQEELLVRRQAELEEQMQKHREALKDLLNDKQARRAAQGNRIETQKAQQFSLSSFFKDVERNYQEEVNHADKNKNNESKLLSENVNPAEQTGELPRILGRGWRPSKPPLARVKLGLALEQHELSAIQEVESPRSGRVSAAGESDSVEEASFESVLGAFESSKPTETTPDERNATRSPSQEQSGQGSPPESGQSSPFMQCLRQILSAGYAESVQAKDYIVESQEPPTCAPDVGKRALSPDDNVILSRAWSSRLSTLQAEAHERSSDQLSSTSISTGSFFSHEEEVDLSPLTTDVAGGLDLLDLEQNFPSLHRQLFQPLEPKSDSSVPSLSHSGISQDTKDPSKSSDCSPGSVNTAGVSETPPSSSELRGPRLNAFLKIHHPSQHSKQQRDVPTLSAASLPERLSTENILGTKDSFHPLLPECTSSEESQSGTGSKAESTASKVSSQVEPENRESRLAEQYEELSRNDGNFDLRVSVEKLQRLNLNSSEKPSGFGRLTALRSPPDELAPSDDLMTGFGSFTELPDGKADEMDGSPKAPTGSESGESGGVQGWPDIPEETLETGNLDRTLRAEPQQVETSLESPATAILFGVRRESLLPTPLPPPPAPWSLKSPVPVWETESGLGILEEPELTLISSTEISIADVDLEPENQEGKLETSSQGRKLLPLDPEVDSSSSPQEGTSAYNQPAGSPARRTLETPPSQRRLSAPALQKVSEVQVCSPERTAPEALLYHQPLRHQRDEKARKEVTSKSRDRAREFHRKTLEKLRAKNSH
ncbi:centrosomal protein of 295 kDa isoform X2 [Tachyglossus aculeatus]|uniref:centrosomal protein of 295 kDa isoform X2 n=1 Tax=Tachyglossus aculeatus TaxID=9261 RepID=UPI0018F41691|nr:centrosomal protein of 295 kDa isoform X2 [Tachyglossus aculeatus]